jgi:two-component sensor histidine kinase
MTTEHELRLQVENLDLRRLLAQAGVDAVDQKTRERLQRVVLEELHHRIKNTLATTMAITSQTLRSAENLEQAGKAIADRLIALGRAHDLLLQTNWESTPLEAIVANAIEPFDGEGGGRFFVQSSDIFVSSTAILPLAMLLNELCTNAVRYGALSTANGHVEISAKVDALGEQFRLRWAEKGGPTVVPPTRRSLGSRLIEHSFPSQLQGVAGLSFEPSGVVCVFDIPMASLKDPASTG